jgi:serine/threonine protein kinase/Flp pilus assembly protein TadD/TolB-like protein
VIFNPECMDWRPLTRKEVWAFPGDSTLFYGSTIWRIYDPSWFMAIRAGTRLGSYEIGGSLGAGGMGEVYQARDTRLEREVAIKVLPETLAGDPLRLSRFEREARLLAALNHPNVAAIYGLEDCDQVRFLVLELVSGLTLSDKIASSGSLPLQEALQCAIQIAEGLEAAHEKGVIHRDLKPSNIKVTEEGKVKVLDFGLAKEMESESSSSDSSQSPTASMEGTQQGTILGTAAYMSPEQARGHPLDKRTDIWSFGCVLFEMLSGKKVFDGGTTSDRIAAILSRDPDWNLLPQGTPRAIRELLRRCLHKDLKKRLRDIGDARMELEEVLSGRARPRTSSLTARRTFILLGALVMAMIVLGKWVLHKPPPASPTQKYLVVLPFKDMNGEQQFAEGLAEMVSTRLVRVPGIQVWPPATVKGLSVSESDLPRVVQNLGANLALGASMQRVGDQIHVSYSMYSFASKPGSLIGGGDVSGSVGDLFALRDRLADGVVNALQLQFQLRSDPEHRRGLETAAAQDSYLKALGYLQRYEDGTSIENAIALLKNLSNPTNSALVQAALGRAYLYKYDLTHQSQWADEAIAYCQRAGQLDPQMPEVHVTLGLLRTRTGHAQEGIDELQGVLKEQPNWPDAVLGLGEAYEGAGRSTEAEQTYRRAIELQPGYWACYNKLGNFYLRHGQFSQALERYQQVVKLSPDNSRGYNNLGVALQQKGSLAQAREAYKKSIALLPNGDAYSNLGTLEYTQGQYKEAAEAYEKAVGLVPGRSTYWANLGDASRWAPSLRSKATPAYQQAILLAKDELRVNPKNAGVHVTLALCFAKTGNCLEAQKHVRQALDLNPNDPDNMFQAAIVANVCGKRQEALGWIRKAVQQDYPVSVILQEPELASLREDKEFQETLRGDKKSPTTK